MPMRLRICAVVLEDDEADCAMPRMARLVMPGYPHHVTQRWNRRQRTFFQDADYVAYMNLFAVENRAGGNPMLIGRAVDPEVG